MCENVSCRRDAEGAGPSTAKVHPKYICSISDLKLAREGEGGVVQCTRLARNHFDRCSVGCELPGTDGLAPRGGAGGATLLSESHLLPLLFCLVGMVAQVSRIFVVSCREQKFGMARGFV